MAKYIDRDALLEKIEQVRWISKNSFPRQHFVVGDVMSCIRTAPDVDVVGVRRGRWLTTDAYPHHLYCSVCYKTYAKNAKWVNELDLPTNYCPNCGARMGKEDEHEIG